MPNPPKRRVTDQLSSGDLTAKLTISPRETKADREARIELEAKEQEHQRYKERVLLWAAIIFAAVSGVVCTFAVLSPWSSAETQRWATTLLTAIVTSVVSFKAGKDSK